MSEIKGQLLGIILVLMIFAAVSGVVALVFKNAGDTITEKAEHTFDDADSTLVFASESTGGEEVDGEHL